MAKTPPFPVTGHTKTGALFQDSNEQIHQPWQTKNSVT
jgi:hypothetical protein